MGEDDVLRLDVAVHDAHRVQSLEGGEQLSHERADDERLATHAAGIPPLLILHQAGLHLRRGAIWYSHISLGSESGGSGAGDEGE